MELDNMIFTQNLIDVFSYIKNLVFAILDRFMQQERLYGYLKICMKSRIRASSFELVSLKVIRDYFISECN